MRLRRLVIAILGAAQLGANCVDGATPDCSDAAVCAPSMGDGFEGGLLPEAAAPEAGDATDAADAAVGDAHLDADAHDAHDARDGR